MTLEEKFSRLDGAEVTGSDPVTFTIENIDPESDAMVFKNLRMNYTFEVERVDINDDGNLEAVIRE